MQSQRYQQLNPLALAVAAGSVALIGALLIGFPMIGMMNMMGGDGGRGMMGSYGSGHMLGFGMFWVVGALLPALFGAVFGWIYNAVNARARADTNAPGSVPHASAPR